MRPAFHREEDADDPTDYYLHAEDVRCVPADSVIQIPAGRWLHYVRHTARNRISSSPTAVAYNGPDAAPDVFGRNVIDLEPAATLDLSAASADLNPDESFAVYASNEGTDQLPMIFPVPRGQSSVLVPASMPLLVLRREHRRIVAVGDPIRLDPAEYRKADPLGKTRSGAASVVAWIAFPQEVRTPEQPWRKVPAPDVRVLGSETVRTPVLAPRAGFGSDGALMVFRNVPAGTTTVRAGGGIWSVDELSLQLPASGLAVVPRPLMIRPGAILRARWTVAGDGVSRATDCNGHTRSVESRPASITLFRCPALQPGMSADFVNPTECAVAAKPVAFDRNARVANFEAVPPGLYVLVVNEPPFPPSRQVVELTTADVVSKDALLRAFRIFGRVIIEGRPASAQIEFASGSAVSDESGAYDVGLARDPRDLPIHVRPCSDTNMVRTHFPESPLVENRPYDLVFERNEVELHVLDDATHSAVAGATVTLGVLHQGSDGTGDFVADTPSTDATGTATLRDLPASRRLMACAQAPRYQRACTAPFSISGTRTTQTVTLVRTPYQGVIAGAAPLRWGRVIFASPAGVTSESAFVKEDGTFNFHQPHLAPEYAVVVSDSPMFVADLPVSMDESLALKPVGGSVRNLEVRIGGRQAQRDGMVGLIVDGRYIPAMALSLHQGARNLQGHIYGGGPLLIPSLLVRNSVQVILGPSPTDPVVDSFVTTDIFTDPSYRLRFPVRSADAAGHVTF